MLQHDTSRCDRAPHEEQCRTRELSADFSVCLAEPRRRRCNYACFFVDGYLCTHPDHRSFR